ncbi:MAG: DNA polymerase III subunit beta [bacterium]
MKVRIKQDDLSRVLSLVTGVVPTSSAIPVLSNLLLETEGENLKISATDLDISVISSVGCEIGKQGAITVAAKRLQEIVRELPDEDIDIKVDGEKISITCSRSTFRMMGMEKEQFPKIANLVKEKKIKLSGDLLEKMIRRSVYSVARDDTRPVLSGVLWELGGSEIAMVGTDGHRLSRMAATGGFGISDEQSVIVPPKALTQIQRLIGAGDEVEVAIDKAFVGFFVGGTVVYARRIEGTFPNYKQVIPKSNPNVMSIDRAELNSATRRVSLLADSKTHKMKMHLGKAGVKLTASTPDLGEAEEELQATYDGEEMVVGFNASYIIDVLKTTESETMRFEMGTPVGATIVRPAEEPEGETYMCLVMPLRLADQT